MFRIITITALAVILLLSGAAVVYAQTAGSPALARMHQFDNGTFTESVQEMQEVCLTQGGMAGLTEEQRQEHLDTMQQHMSDGTMQEHMTDGTCQQHMSDGTMEEMHQDMNGQMGSGNMQDHMSGGTNGTGGPTGNGSTQGHMGGGTGGRMGM